MERHFGLPLEVRAQDQLQRIPASAAIQKAQLLPAGNPGRVTPESVGIVDASPLAFLCVGDVGGVVDPGRQLQVSAAMGQRVAEAPAPAFLYLLGDIVYLNGEESQYGPQFYEPYAHLTIPIVGIPGNHDGDTSDDPARTPLDAFMTNFCAPEPTLPLGANCEYNRDVQTQPFCDWTLALNELTIIGLYDNVPDGGHLYDSQIAWLEAELQSAPVGRPLVICLHHPPYSIDASHGGSAKMGAILDAAFSKSGRVPQLVLSGHVHAYQRFTRRFGGAEITYVVAGNGGYHNLHTFAPDAVVGTEISDEIVFAAGDDQNWGFMSFISEHGTLRGTYTSISRDGQVCAGSDSFLCARPQSEKRDPIL